MYLDDFLPDYDFSEKHKLLIQGTCEDAYNVFTNLNAEKSKLLKMLLRLRGIKSTKQLSQMFVTLRELPPHECIRCMVARPWTIRGGVVPIEKSQFIPFQKPGYAKVVWGIKFTEIAHGCLVQTETRIQCTDSSSRKKFGVYWFFIRPFSGLIRRIMLNMISNGVKRRDHSPSG